MGWKTFRDKFQIKYPVFCSNYGHIMIYGGGWSIYCYNNGEVSGVKNLHYCGFEDFRLLEKSTKQDRIDAINAVDKFDCDLPLFCLTTPDVHDGIGEYSIKHLLCESYGDDGYIYDQHGLRPDDEKRIKTTHCGMPIYDFDDVFGKKIFFKTKQDAIDYAVFNNDRYIDDAIRQKEKALDALFKLQEQKDKINML